MSHFILDILNTPSYPFVGEAPPDATGIIRDIHIMWWTACDCIQITVTEEKAFFVFKATKGAAQSFLYADIPLPFTDAPVPLVDASGIAWGWVLPGMSTEVPLAIKGVYPLIPSLMFPSENPTENTDPYIEVTVAGGIVIEIDAANNHITFGCDELLYSRTPDYQTEEGALGEKGVGIYRLGPAAGEHVRLSLEDGTVFRDAPDRLILVPDFSVTITTEAGTATHLFTLSELPTDPVTSAVVYGTPDDSGYMPVFFNYLSATSAGTVLTVTDAKVPASGTTDTDLPTLKGPWVSVTIGADVFTGYEGETLSGPTETPDIVVHQVWRGCDGNNPLIDGLVCSIEDGSAIPYPLDSKVCEGEYCPPAWESAE